MLGKHKWRSCSSQLTPYAAKLLALEPPSLFVKPQEQNPSMRHLLHSQILILVQCQPPTTHGHTNIQYFSQDLVIYESPSLQYSTRICDLIFGDDASCILSSHSVASTTCIFFLWVSKNSLKSISICFPLQHILLNKNVLLQIVLFLNFLSKIIKL